MEKYKYKLLLIILLASIFFNPILFNTYSNYEKKIVSEDGKIESARFDIRPGKFRDLDFDKRTFSIKDMYPDCETTEFPITIIKHNEDVSTDVPVEYTISLNSNENYKKLFESINAGGKTYASPIKFALKRKNSDGIYKTVEYDHDDDNFLNNSFTLSDAYSDKNLNPSDIEDFKILCSWPQTTDKNDTLYAGLAGKVDIEFNASQVVVEKKTEKYPLGLYFQVNSYNYPKSFFTNLTIAAYIENGLKTLEIGNVVTSTPVSLKINNLKLIQRNKNSNIYTATCEENSHNWNGKEFTLVDGNNDKNKYYIKFDAGKNYILIYPPNELIEWLEI
jgi:hypothetical protein